MKAIVQHTYGSADVLEVAQIDQPDVGDDEVLVRVHAAGVDRGVWHLTAGLPYPVRLAGYGLRTSKNPCPAWISPGSWKRSPMHPLYHLDLHHDRARSLQRDAHQR